MTEIIAEIGQAHDGSVGILHSLIDGAADAGVDAVKFQMHIAEAESSDREEFRVPFSWVDQTRTDYWKRMELTQSQWVEIRDHCDQRGVEFLVTPFSRMAVEWLEQLEVRRYKVGSGDIGNQVLLESIRRTGKEVILSTGLADGDQIERAVDRLGQDRVTILHCVTMYPTPPEKVQLERMTEIQKRFGVPVGLSDHSGTIYPGLAAVALGAAMIECHVTFDKRMFGPDSRASLTLDEFTRLVEGVRFLEKAVPGGTEDSEKKADLRKLFGRSLAVSRDLDAGEVLELENLEGKKPAGEGIPAEELDRVVGSRLKQAKRKWEFLREEDIV